MAKQTLLGKVGRKKVLLGMKKAFEAVSPTLGSVGKSAMLSNGNYSPDIIDDGLAVLRNFSLSDPYENMGAQIIKKLVIEINDKVGDARTTSAVLGYMITREAVKAMGNDFSRARDIEKRLKAGLVEALDIMNSYKAPVDGEQDVKRIATISCLDAELGDFIGSVVSEVGKNGLVTVEEANQIGYSKEVVKGMRIEAGFTSPYFVEEPKRIETVLTNPQILVVDRRVSTNAQVIPLFQQLKASGTTDVLLIAEDIDGEALASLAVNFKTFRIVPVKAPNYGQRRKELMKDICAATGATFITEDVGLRIENMVLSELGNARRVVITKNHLTILDGKGSPEAVQARVDVIETEIAQSTSDLDKEQLRARLAGLTGGVGLIHVGAYTDIELRNKKSKIEDAVRATQGALEEGVVSGGGACLGFIGDRIKDPIFKKALRAPFEIMQINSGMKTPWWKPKYKFRFFWVGIDFKTLKETKLYMDGIIDSAKSTRIALEQTVSTAARVITSETFMVDEQEIKNYGNQES